MQYKIKYKYNTNTLQIHYTLHYTTLQYNTIQYNTSCSIPSFPSKLVLTFPTSSQRTLLREFALLHPSLNSQQLLRRGVDPDGCNNSTAALSARKKLLESIGSRSRTWVRCMEEQARCACGKHMSGGKKQV
eukprot:g299.t1